MGIRAESLGSLDTSTAEIQQLNLRSEAFDFRPSSVFKSFITPDILTTVCLWLPVVVPRHWPGQSQCTLLACCDVLSSLPDKLVVYTSRQGLDFPR